MVSSVFWVMRSERRVTSSRREVRSDICDDGVRVRIRVCVGVELNFSNENPTPIL